MPVVYVVNAFIPTCSLLAGGVLPEQHPDAGADCEEEEKQAPEHSREFTLIEDLKKDPNFRKELELLKTQHRLEPKMYHPKNAIAEDEWKYESGWIAGFDFLYQLLTEVKK
jgi:hypothetical protein